MAQFIDIRQKALHLLHGHRRVAGGNQPLNRDSKGNPRCPGRQVQFRRQRAVPPPRNRGPARRTKKIRPKSKLQVRPGLHPAWTATSAAWLDGAGHSHGHHGHHQAVRREAAAANRFRTWAAALPEVAEAFKDHAGSPKGQGIWSASSRHRKCCDTIATGVITAAKAVNLNDAAGRAHEGAPTKTWARRSLKDSGLPIISADSHVAEATRSSLRLSKRIETPVDLHQQRHRRHHPGASRQDRPVPHRKVPGIRQQELLCRRREPKEGR